ncbi:MAG: tetratricopeptide repeat protein [Bacteroidia bacterium]|nr:tetratricopeptide repeat protein [Bacteroidia bacterium]
MKKPKGTEQVVQKTKTIEPKSSNIAWIWMLSIVVLTFIVYQSVTSFDSTNWDDKAYLKETPMVVDLTLNKTKQIFTEKVLKSYNPIVLLTFAFDYKMSKLSPGWCHGVNLFFHLMNAVLVFMCMRKLRFKTEHAGLIAILFSVHPLASEAVTWIAGRKDVVYLFFFLLSWKFYLDFFTSSKKMFLGISILFFILALLSKVQAITLPFVLIASDLMLDKKFDQKKLFNKIPYVLLAILFGVIAISGDGELVADKYSVPLTFIDKLVYSVMAFGLYIYKIVFPFNQIAMYQFPKPGSSEYVTDLVIGVAALVLVCVGFILTIKKNPRLAAGLLLFSVSIFPVLHLVAVNSALIYERFVYLADIGIFIAVFALIEKIPAHEKKLTYLIGGICLVFSGLTFARIPVWENSLSLWTDVVTKDPTSADAFTNRGQYFESIGDHEKAFQDFSQSIKLNPNKPDGYHNRAVSYFNMKDLNNALIDNQHALDIDPRFSSAIVNRAAIFFNLEKNDSAIFYYKKALEINPRNAKAYYECAASYYKMNDFNSAIVYFKKATEVLIDYSDAYTYMAVSYAKLNMINEAQFAINASEKYTPNSAARSMVCSELLKQGNKAYADGRPDKALETYNLAGQIMPTNPEVYYNIGGIYLMKGNLTLAKENWQKTLNLDPNHAKAKDWMIKTAGAR